jgi:hypothetical protein
MGLIKECRTALEPDFAADTKVHHRSKCWFVDSYEEGSWDGKRRFMLVPLADVPDEVEGCSFCDGRSAPEKVRSEARPRGNLGVELSEPVDVGPKERVDAVGLGRTVRVLDNASDALETWTIVSPAEVDVSSGKLSVESPIAKALLGHVGGETVTAETPRGPRQFKIQELLP